MVAFNPETQVTPGYLYGEESSRPISPIPADLSKETLFKGLAAGIEGGAKVGTGYLEQRILEQEHQGLDSINDAAIQRLTQAKANPLLAQNDATKATPEAVKSLPSTLDKLDQARLNGKISQTYIDMQKDALAKALRSQYPGFRDFVDESFAKSNREDPANRYITSMIGDIDSMVSSARAARNRTETLVQSALEKGFPGSPDMANGWHAGNIPDAEIRNYYYKYSQLEWKHKMEEYDLAARKGAREDISYDANQIARERVNTSVVDTWNTKIIASGMTGPQILAKAKEGGVGGVDAEKYATQIAIAASQWETETRSKLMSHIEGDPGLGSMADLIGPTAVEELIKSGKQQFIELGSALGGPHADVATEVLRINKAMVEDTTHQLFTSKDQDFNSMNLTMAGMKNMLGPAFDRFQFQVVAPSNYDKSLHDFLTWRTEQSFGPDPSKVPPVTDTLKTIIKSDKSPQDKAAAVKDAITGPTGINAILDKDMPREAKERKVQAFYGEGNREFLRQFTRGSQAEAFNTLANDKLTAEIHKLGGKSWDLYKGWIQDTFNTQIYQQDIETLKQLPSSYQIGWDNVNHQIVPRFQLATQVGKAGTPSQFGSAAAVSATDQQADQAKEAIDHINAGLKGISSISNVEGSDVNAYLLRMLVTANLTGLAGEFKKAVINANTVPPKQENYEK